MKNLNSNTPFKTPEKYFEHFSDELLTKLGEEKLKLPIADGFTTPDGYFDDLQKNIHHKLETKVVSLHPYRKYYLIAASVAAVLLLVFGLNWKTAPALEFDQLAATDIETYFNDNAYGLSSYEIAEMLPVNDLEINDILEKEFNEEKVIEYLNQNIDDFEELNIEVYE